MIKELSKTNEQDTIVGPNVRVSGKLHTSSNIQINGQVKGEVSSEGNVIIGKTAVIEGPITASEIRIEGTVKGNITAYSALELNSQAKIFGDIQTKTLAVQPGAIFIGKSNMETKEEPEEIRLANKEKDQKEPKPELDLE